MKYEKPEVIAKSINNESFVAGCPLYENLAQCIYVNKNCQMGPTN